MNSIPEAILPRGMRDLDKNAIAGRSSIGQAIENIYQLHGFRLLETSAVEYADSLGDHLPDDTRGNGIFTFQDKHGDTLALRYDMTAPLARYVAQNKQDLAFPFRRYAAGPVWRDDNPGPGRYREFWQYDADIVGAPVGAADAEMCAMTAEILEAVGLKREQYSIRLSDRRILDGMMEDIGIEETVRPEVFRAIDKLDRLGIQAVEKLLGFGRKDYSGDFKRGAGLSTPQIHAILTILDMKADDPAAYLKNLREIAGDSQKALQGIDSLEEIVTLLDAFPCGSGAVQIDPSIVRGLGYYTGPVFEAVLNLEILDTRGHPKQFGSVAGGGRYDQLVQRFSDDPPRDERLPKFRSRSFASTGMSIGIDRLAEALEAANIQQKHVLPGPVLVLSMGDMPAHQRAAAEIRKNSIPVEVYTGEGNMRQQMRYADRIHSTIAVIEGENEKKTGTVMVKDLLHGAKIAEGLDSNKKWKEYPSQIQCPRDQLARSVHEIRLRQAKESQE